MKDQDQPKSGYGDIPSYPGYGGYPGTGQSSRIPRYIQFLKRLWWVPVLTVALTLSAASFYSVMKPPAYVSNARLWVSGKLQFKEGNIYSEELQFFFGTQMELLQSDKLHQAAMARVQTMNPNLAPCPVELKVRQAPKSSMFILDAIGDEPTYTQAYLDALIEEYLAYKKQVRAGTSEETLSSLSEQVYQHEKELKKEQETLTAYQRENNLPVLQEQSQAAGAYLGRLSAQLSDLKLENQFMGAMAAEFTTNATGTNLANAASTALISPGYANQNVPPELAMARQQLQLMRVQREELSPFLRPKHPKMQRLNDEITRAEKLIAMFQQQSIDQLEPTRQARLLKIQAIEDQIKEWEGKLMDANRRIAEFQQLKANIDRIQGVYQKLLGLFQSLDINKSLDQEVVSVMEKASPAKPARVNLPVTLAAACFVGIAGGLMLVFLVARIDDRLTSMNELMEQFDEEIVGQVPEIKRGRKGKLQLVQPDDERHMFAESYRNIRSSVFFMPNENVRPKLLLITSAIPNEGKSTVSANLARTLAFAGGRVLLIDGDMRRGKQQEYFGIDKPAKGFSELLHNPKGKLDDYMVSTQLPNLMLIPAGEPITDASECFLSDDFQRLISDARQRFDHIIIDSAPVFAADDAPTLAPKVDGVLFVLRSGFTKAGMARQALDILYQRQAKVLGLVFNRANTKAGSYYYYKYADYYYSGKKKAAG